MMEKVAMERVTTVLEVVGLVLITAALAAAVFYGIAWPWDVPAAAATGGGGLIVSSWLIESSRRGRPVPVRAGKS